MIEEEEYEVDEIAQASEYYQYMYEQIEEKFKNMTTDTMELIQNRMKRKQNKEEL